MPPDLDIYVASRNRDQGTIERFLDEFVDRVASEDRGDEELMLLPIGADGSPNQLEDWEWEPAVSLSHIMKRGLTVPSRAFTVALKAKDPSISCVTLGFTPNNYVVFGLSIDDEGAMPENMDRAKALLRALAEKFGGVRGWIGVEMPTPLTGTPDRSDLILHTWKAESWE